MTSFSRPTRSALIDRDKADLNGRMPGADSRLRRSTVGAVATMHGGGMDAAYGYLGYIADQVMPDTADLEHLLRWAAIWGITPKGASFAADTATAVNACTNGVDIPIGTVLQRGDNATFVTTTDVHSAGATAHLVIQAQTAGAAGNSDAGVVLTMVNPIGGVSSTFTVDGTSPTIGADAETPPQLLSRLLQRIQNPPKGGAAGDYVAWALEVPGVTRAWEAPLWMGLGTVGVFFVFDGRVNPLPLAGDITAMDAWMATKAPETAVVYNLAPAALVTPFSIALTPSGDATLEAAVEAELADLFTRLADPVGTEILKWQYDQAIGEVVGLGDFNVTVPAGAITPAIGQLPTLGAITWL